MDKQISNINEPKVGVNQYNKQESTPKPSITQESKSINQMEESKTPAESYIDVFPIGGDEMHRRVIKIGRY